MEIKKGHNYMRLTDSKFYCVIAIGRPEDGGERIVIYGGDVVSLEGVAVPESQFYKDFISMETVSACMKNHREFQARMEKLKEDLKRFDEPNED